MDQALFPLVKPPAGYAIYRPADGLWSKGGTAPAWKKAPKIWSNIGHMKNHLNLFVGTHYVSASTKCSSFGSDVGHFVISRIYDGCHVIDVTTGLSLGGNWINEYYFDYIRRQKADRKYYADYPAKFRGDQQWLTL